MKMYVVLIVSILYRLLIELHFVNKQVWVEKIYK